MASSDFGGFWGTHKKTIPPEVRVEDHRRHAALIAAISSEAGSTFNGYKNGGRIGGRAVTVPKL
jgi:beta-galactosidase GanA